MLGFSSNCGVNFGSNQSQVTVDAVTRMLKLPVFAREDPRLWFTQIEFIMNASRVVTQRSRAGAVLSVLDSGTIQAINVLISPQELVDDLYDQIKSRLIATFQFRPRLVYVDC